jgi:hypothetical protein
MPFQPSICDVKRSREPLAGLIAVSVGAFDLWHFGRDRGLSANLDEIVIIGGIVLLTGSKDSSR